MLKPVATPTPTSSARLRSSDSEVVIAGILLASKVLADNADGRLIIREFIEIAKAKGEGWVEYMWPKPEEMSKPMEQRISSKKASEEYTLRELGGT